MKVFLLFIFILLGCNSEVVVVVNGGNTIAPVPTVTLLSAPNSTQFPQVQVNNLTVGDLLYLVQDSDATCTTGKLMQSGVAAATTDTLTADVWGVTSLNHTYRVKVVKSDGSTTCSDPVGVSHSLTTGVTKVVGGGHFFCALLGDKTVRCWGNNDRGYLGVGINDRTITMANVPGLTDVVDIAAGKTSLDGNHMGHVCAVKNDGTVWCWGRNSEGQLGVDDLVDRNSPTQVLGITDAVKVSASMNHTCVVRNPAVAPFGIVSCWGAGTAGQLGDNNAVSSDTPVNVSPLLVQNVISISTGRYFTCVVLSDNTVRCWGDGTNGRLGNGLLGQQDQPVTVTGLNDAVSISSGEATSCVITTGQTLKCWGGDNNGILANGLPFTDSSTFITVPTFSNVQSIAFGNSHACASFQSGNVKCWGHNGYHQLGDGNLRIIPNNPVDVLDISDAISVGAGNVGSCAIVTGGRVRCWGNEEHGGTGAKVPIYSSIPRTAATLANYKDWFTSNYHTCVTRLNDSLECGNPNMKTFTGITGVKGIHNGGGFTCTLMLNGTVKCWGENTYGQLGIGNFIDNFNQYDSANAIPVLLINDAIELKGGNRHACVLRGSDNTIWCWGRNVFGQLGNGADFNDNHTPAQVAVPGNVVHWDTAANTVCAVNHLGEVYCWGSGTDRQIGNGANLDVNAPTLVQNPVGPVPITTAVEVSVSDYKACALLADTTVQCWGSYFMGNGVGSSNIPLTVTDSLGTEQVEAVAEGGCLRFGDGTVKCWGNGWYGIGDGAYTARGTPVPVLVENAVLLKASGYRVCAEQSTGAVKCWGNVNISSNNPTGGITTYPVSNYVVTP